MSVRRKSSKKALSAFTSLMVLFALMVPFAGTALAAHVSNVSLTPESDTAPANTCNAFTVTLTGPLQANDTNPGVPGETIDVIVTDSDADNATTTTTNEAQSDFQFCNPPPPATQQGTSDEFGPNPQAPRPGQSFQDDPNSTNPVAGQPANNGFFTNGTGQTEFCCTDVNGQITFGILSNEVGTFSVTAFFDDRGQNNPTDGDDSAQGDFADTSTKTFTAPPATGNQGVTQLNCEPETDINPEGTAHSFNCVATDVNGNNVSGVTVSFDVTAGPNAEEVGPTNCGASTTTTTNGQTTTTTTGGPTGSNGQATCTYTDTETNNDNNTATADTSTPGTDTIIGFVNQTPGAGQTGTPGADTFEPQDQITKTFVGDANNIECEGEDGDTAEAGDIVEVECTVTDVSGQPVPNVDVEFDEEGAGVFRGASSCTTDANGTCSVQIETDESEAGEDIVVVATISNFANQPDANGFTGDTNCGGAGGTGGNGTPDAGTSANCTDTVTIELEEEPVVTQCNNGVDDDGDGRVDFPNDAGCASAQDATETGETPPPPTEVRRDRNLKITEIKHVRLPGKSKPALLIKGRVTSPDFESCASEVPIKVQIFAGGEFITRKSDTTNATGVFKVLIRDVQAKYRAVAPKFQIEDTDNNQIDICLKAQDVKRHNH